MAGCFTLLFLGNGPFVGSSGVFLVPLVRSFHSSHAHVARVVTASLLTMGLFSLAAGWLVDWVGARLVMSLGVLAYALGYWGASSAHSLRWVTYFYAVAGVGAAFAGRVPIMVVAVNWFKERSGTASGLAMFGNSWGMTLAPLVVAWLITSYGWRVAMRGLALPLLLIGFPLCVSLIRTRPSQGQVKSAAEQLSSLAGLELRPALCTLTFWLLMIAELLFSAANAGVLYHMAIYEVGLGYGLQTAARMLSLMTIVGGVGVAAAGWLADRLGVKQLQIVTMLLMATGILSLMSASNRHIGLWGVAGCSLLYGTGGASQVTLLPILVAQTLGLRRMGSLTGIIVFLATLASAFGPILSGWIFDRSGSYLPAFALCSLLAISAALAISQVRAVEGHNRTMEATFPATL